MTVNSKSLFEFKRDILKLPVGVKSEIKILEVLLSEKLVKNVMKGLGDTDFSLSFKKNRKRNSY